MYKVNETRKMNRRIEGIKIYEQKVSRELLVLMLMHSITPTYLMLILTLNCLLISTDNHVHNKLNNQE